MTHGQQKPERAGSLGACAAVHEQLSTTGTEEGGGGVAGDGRRSAKETTIANEEEESLALIPPSEEAALSRALDAKRSHTSAIESGLHEGFCTALCTNFFSHTNGQFSSKVAANYR